MQGYIRKAIYNEENIFYLSNKSIYNNSSILISDYDVTDFILTKDAIAFISSGDIFFYNQNDKIVDQLTFHGSVSRLCFSDKNDIFYISAHEVANRGQDCVYKTDMDKNCEKVNCGEGSFFHRAGNISLLKRHGYGYTKWKNYRGGTSGEMWVKDNEEGYKKITVNNDEVLKITSNYTLQTIDFFKKGQKVPDSTGNISEAFIYEDRIIFSADFCGARHVYSCDFSGNGIIQHTQGDGSYYELTLYEGYATVIKDGKVYYMNLNMDLENDKKAAKITETANESLKFDHVNITNYHNIHNRKYLKAEKYLQDITVTDNLLNITTRGKSFIMPIYGGGAINLGEQVVKYSSFFDNKTLVSIIDDGAKDYIQIYDCESNSIKKTIDINLGRIIAFDFCKKNIVLSNHKGKLFYIKDFFENEKEVLLAEDHYAPISDFSANKNIIVYQVHTSYNTAKIVLYDTNTEKKHELTDGHFYDFSPYIDNKFVYFLSKNHFDSLYSHIGFNMEFDDAIQAYIVPLDNSNPLDIHEITIEEDEKNNDQKDDNEKDIEVNSTSPILFTQIAPGNYSHIFSFDKKVALVLHEDNHFTIKTFSFDTHIFESLYENLQTYCLSKSSGKIILKIKDKHYVTELGAKIDESDKSYKKGGLIDFSRIQSIINLKKEWRFIFEEAVRLQKDFFWRRDCEKEIENIANKYRGLIDNLTNRDDLNRIIDEFHGELQTSHSYILSIGDVEKKESTPQKGFLGAKFEYCEEGQKIIQIYDSNIKKSPLTAANVKVGDIITHVNMTEVSKNIHEMLYANIDMFITVKKTSGESKKISIRPLSSEKGLIYQNWVQNNIDYVHKKSNGEIGYIHIPDMSRFGFNEFYRNYSRESSRKGLIIDIRFNGGGNVSSIILQKLSQTLWGYDANLNFKNIKYPHETPPAMVLLANEYTGSDGDMFTYVFKKSNLGKVIGKRTWGGVVGISPQYKLIDSGMTSQASYPFMFYDDKEDVFIENIGVYPDIEIENTPEDNIKNIDMQMNKALEEIVRLI